MIVLNSSQIVWTPIIGKDSVAVALHAEFARACMGYKLDQETAQRITQVAWENVGRAGAFTPSNFFQFGSTLLLQGVYYKPGDGVWLTLDSGAFSGRARPVMYHGHNEDRHAEDRLFLLQAFGEWASSAQVLLEWK